MENQKPFEQLNDVELLELEQEQIDFYINLKKAEAGIKIIPCPETPKYREIPEKDLKLYHVSDFYFKDDETAQEIAKFINGKIDNALKTNYEWSVNNGDSKYAEPYEGNLIDVTIEMVYKKSTYDSIKDILISNGKIKAAYNTIKEAYDNENEKSTEIVDSIYEAIDKAKERKARREEYKKRIVEYLRLSNGDTDVAWNFFEKAYEIEPTEKNKILESEEYLEAVNGYRT
jgi:hypothetical protein